MTSLSLKPRVPVFDANVKVGNHHNEVSPCPDRAGLLAEMDTHGREPGRDLPRPGRS